MPDAIWSDWYPLDETSQGVIRAFLPQNKVIRTQLFGGVAHKAALYTDDPEASALAAQMVDGFVDYATTTGRATGEPVPLPKVEAMRSALRRAKLAIASGVDADNIGTYVPHVDAILLASSIEVKGQFGVIDPERLSALMTNFKRAVEVVRESRVA